MLILSIKSRQQILKERNNPESVWNTKSIIVFITPTPEKNAEINDKQRATSFCRLLPIVSKKIHRKAVVRNKFRRRIKEAFRLIDKTLLKNQYDYQVIARQGIFNASFNDIKEDIELCLQGKANYGAPERNATTTKKSKKNNVQIKTSEALKKKTNS